MMSNGDIAALARTAAQRSFAPGDVIDAVSEATLDFEGAEAVEITLVVQPGTLDRA